MGQHQYKELEEDSKTYACDSYDTSTIHILANHLRCPQAPLDLSRHGVLFPAKAVSATCAKLEHSYTHKFTQQSLRSSSSSFRTYNPNEPRSSRNSQYLPFSTSLPSILTKRHPVWSVEYNLIGVVDNKGAWHALSTHAYAACAVANVAAQA